MADPWSLLHRFPNPTEADLAVASLDAAGIRVRQSRSNTPWAPALTTVEVFVLTGDLDAGREALGLASEPAGRRGGAERRRRQTAMAQWRTARLVRWGWLPVFGIAMALSAIWPGLVMILAPIAAAVALGLFAAGVGLRSLIRCPACSKSMFLLRLPRSDWPGAKCTHCGFDLEPWRR